ncbi:membrane protein [Oceanicola sp. 22II-s10i]|uniref:DUF1206 domain-containing protein n=1 Tax=Oceanicola sp. 22II-s10i TaxID=1317116 RepID=UPI000B52138F|nr:DUF1206 domain-containing protein [Oceanicola sp. 22II-s10i]OWU85236.1 membrane protein [Oceanicola sp. 22II-s10i]
MSKDLAPGWVVPVMRLGYSARGIVYIVVGGLALLAAWKGGDAEGTQGALAQLKAQPWGTPLLFLIAAGLFAYTVWRLICAWMDLEDRGHGVKGVIARTGQTVTGLIHAALSFSVVRLALGDSSGEGGGTESLTSKVLAMENGKLIVMVIGGITICAGLYYGYKAIAEKYKEHIRCTATTEKLDPAIKAGLIAHGVVIVLIGTFLYYAGQSTDPGQAGGIGQAFETVRAQPYGRILLGLLALGTLGFALYCFVEAIYRVVPRATDDEITTLATRAKAKARGEMHRAAAQVH